MGRNKISDVIGWKAIVLCTAGRMTMPKMMVRSNTTGDKMSNPQLFKNNTVNMKGGYYERIKTYKGIHCKQYTL